LNKNKYSTEFETKLPFPIHSYDAPRFGIQKLIEKTSMRTKE